MALPTSPKRVAFDLSNELIEQLLLQFDQKDFKKLVKIEGRAVSFVLPDMILSGKKSEERVCEFGINEKLGAYQIKSWDTPDEGSIILYYETIWETVGEYLVATPSVTSSKEECFDALTSIVTIHELVHWLMHYVIGFVPLKYIEENEIAFHEAFAQLFTWLTIRDLTSEDGELLRDIFKWLADCRQSEVYRLFRKCTKLDSDELLDFEEGIKLLKFCKGTGIQNIVTTKPSIKMMSLAEGNLLSINDPDVPYWSYFFNNNEFKNWNSLCKKTIYKRLPAEVQHQFRGRYHGDRFGI